MRKCKTATCNKKVSGIWSYCDYCQAKIIIEENKSMTPEQRLARDREIEREQQEADMPGGFF